MSDQEEGVQPAEQPAPEPVTEVLQDTGPSLLELRLDGVELGLPRDHGCSLSVVGGALLLELSLEHPDPRAGGIELIAIGSHVRDGTARRARAPATLARGAAATSTYLVDSYP